MFRIDDVYVGDCIEAVGQLTPESVHLFLSDIPYGIGAEDWDVLHANSNSAYMGSSPAQRSAGSVFARRGKPINGWSEADKAIPREYYEWCLTWAPGWMNALKPGGSAFVFAGRRYAHRCISALEDSGFSFRDMLAWTRPKATYRAQRLSSVFERRGDEVSAKKWEGWRLGNLAPVFEPILWFVKPYRLGKTIADNVLAHELGAYNHAAFQAHTGSFDNVIRQISTVGQKGLHPTQKPVGILESLIALTTLPGQLVVDPFCGSGSTLVAAKNLDRRFIGFERDPEYVKTCKQRLSDHLL